MERLVRARKVNVVNDQARGTHHLETAEGETFEFADRKRLIRGHALPADDKGRDFQDT